MRYDHRGAFWGAELMPGTMALENTSERGRTHVPGRCGRSFARTRPEMSALRAALLFGCLSGLSLLTACSPPQLVSEDAPGRGVPRCVPGRQTACDCPGSATGTQRCLDEGRFGPCSCEDD